MSAPHPTQTHRADSEQAHNHSHDLSGGHHHGSGRVLFLSLCATLAFACVALVAGFYSGSLALLSDGSHMFADTSTLGIGAFASWLVQRPASSTHSLGLQRVEVLGAAFNMMLMLALIVAIAASAPD